MSNKLHISVCYKNKWVNRWDCIFFRFQRFPPPLKSTLVQLFPFRKILIEIMEYSALYLQGFWRIFFCWLCSRNCSTLSFVITFKRLSSMLINFSLRIWDRWFLGFTISFCPLIENLMQLQIEHSNQFQTVPAPWAVPTFDQPEPLHSVPSLLVVDW